MLGYIKSVELLPIFKLGGERLFRTGIAIDCAKKLIAKTILALWYPFNIQAESMFACA